VGLNPTLVASIIPLTMVHIVSKLVSSMCIIPVQLFRCVHLQLSLALVLVLDHGTDYEITLL